ncbi:TetR family transcriptional regulator [Nocardia tenerifensis]|uniref:TetR family transcriptional regulator n=1 Tax=Nocardia tenerifensis TaxID=228006 RepID=A0A318KYM0_9NOCA|nr:TetR/AcrR family transcriptional regulator [Nocardia tenerifensis]PXX70944.1 TetR family transcriptional regulator [Nocardia tenerifensis]
MTSSEAVQGGRRVRNMRDKQARIFEAAAALFAERGFAGVTTQQISDRADVAAGTLFRYASSKGELLLMVYNAELQKALEEGEREARAERDPVRAVLAMTRPIVAAAERQVENTVAYQRELLFGAPTEQYRAEGLALVARLETMIAERLTSAVTASTAARETLFARALLAGRSVFAVLHLILARPSTGAHADRDGLDDLRDQIAQIVAGFFASIE